MEKTNINKCNKDCCLHCGTNYCKFIDEFQQLKTENDKLKQERDLYKTWYRAKHDDLKNFLGSLKDENEKLKSYLNKIREEELKCLDIEWDEYETECLTTDYSNIINLVEEALGENNE